MTPRTRLGPSPEDILQAFFEALVWPASVGRVPASVSLPFQILNFGSFSIQVIKSSGSAKADQWRTTFCVFFIGIFCAWQIYGQIPDVDAPLPPAGSKAEAEEARITKLLRERQLALLLSRTPNPSPEELHRAKTAKPDRNLRRHYANILELTVAIRTLGSRFLSPNDVLRGRDFMSRAFQSWARMGAHMTPYFHLAVHYVEPFLAMGPSYGWWTFPYERNNGFLGRFNHNGHGGGELEATMMRGWWKSMLIYNLVRSPPAYLYHSLFSLTY
jgi:hypothetical protein